mmetsp:Transcript_20614/g.38373  ORF Transcript_20614/g.38373 Transcript_20614/m.38373 type:complete len:82 (+) Transcript_20614:1-246(+)
METGVQAIRDLVVLCHGDTLLTRKLLRHHLTAFEALLVDTPCLSLSTFFPSSDFWRHIDVVDENGWTVNKNVIQELGKRLR